MAAFAGLTFAVTGLAPMGEAGAAVGFCTNPDCASGTPPLRSGQRLAECTDPKCIPGTDPFRWTLPPSNGDIVVGVAMPALNSDSGGRLTAVPNQADPPTVRD